MESFSCIFYMKLLSEFRLKTKLLILAYKAALPPSFKKPVYSHLWSLFPSTSSPIALRNPNVRVLSYLLPCLCFCVQED